MNVNEYPPPLISAAVWETPDMRSALARRDLKTVYELLGRKGVGQREIARRTGQSPSEIHEVLRRNRRIQGYDVLARIADGLGIPRGYMGLAYDHTTEVVLDLAVASCSTDPDERDEIRELLSHAANLTMETSVNNIASWWQPIDRGIAPVPERIDLSDIEQITALIAAMRTLDYRYGGGACRDAVAAQVVWAQQLLHCEAAESTKRMLYTALADLHNLAAWTSFDVGMYSKARSHFGRALEMAHEAGDHSLAANVLYRTGKLHLHLGNATSDPSMFKVALKFFQLGQLTAQDSGCSRTVAVLCANEGLAYAHLGDRRQMIRSLGRAEDELARSQTDEAQAWVRFFGEADLHSSIGIAHTGLPEPDTTDQETGIRHLHHALALRDQDMTRSTCFERTALATAHLRNGSTDLGLHLGKQAVTEAATVRSVRTIDRLAPLGSAARHHRDSELQQLAHTIDTLRAPA